MTPIFLHRSDIFDHNQSSSQNSDSLYPPPIAFAVHHSSCDELSSNRSTRNSYNTSERHVNFLEPFNDTPAAYQYQWPKVIPKSPSSFSMNSFRLQHQHPSLNNKCQNHNWLDDLEYERRKSNASLLKENVKSTDFGTAVWRNLKMSQAELNSVCNRCGLTASEDKLSISWAKGTW